MNKYLYLKWQPKNDARFDGYELAPAKASDYAFVLDGLFASFMIWFYKGGYMRNYVYFEKKCRINKKKKIVKLL